MPTVNKLDYQYKKLMDKVNEHKNDTIEISDDEYMKYYGDVIPDEPEDDEDDHDYSKDYFTIEALSIGTIGIKSIDFEERQDLSKLIEYSLDNGITWNSVDILHYPAYETKNLFIFNNFNIGDKVLIKSNNFFNVIGGSVRSYFGGTAQIKVYGNIMSLIYGDNFINQVVINKEAIFYELFWECWDTLIDAQNLILPAIELSNYCYCEMFKNCTNMIKAPEIPNISPAMGSFVDMFLSCNSLNYIKFIGINTYDKIYNSNCFAGWLGDVSLTGTFIKNKDALYDNKEVIPLGWTIKEIDVETGEIVNEYINE